MSRFAIDILICLVVNLVVAVLVNMFVPNYYLANIISSIVVAFVFGILEQYYDRKHFFAYQEFWYRFLIMAIVFILIDLLFFMMR